MPTQIKNKMLAFIAAHGKDADQNGVEFEGAKYYLKARNRFDYGQVHLSSSEHGDWFSDFTPKGNLGQMRKVKQQPGGGWVRDNF